MLYTPVQLLGMLVRDLLQQPEGSVVQIGRNNFRRQDMTGLQIVVDALTPDMPVARSQSYDGVAEQMHHNSMRNQQCTVDFYGDLAWQEANRFNLLLPSEAGYSLKRDLGIAVYLASSITNVKLLTGEQYSQRFQMTLNVLYTNSISVETLRIDELQLDVIED